MDQSLKTIEFDTQKKYKFDLMLKWRYDETHAKVHELQRRTNKIKKLQTLYETKIKELKADSYSQTSPIE